ncbi:hypothetical protein Aduo_006606 [Ancylostoma duodenale]
MALSDEIKFEREVDKIEAELGEDHLVRMLQYLTSSSPEASQGLLELHSECRNVISKYPPIKAEEEKPKKRTQSQGTMKREDSNPAPSRQHRVQTEKPRIMLTKRTHSLMPLNSQRNIAA